MAPDVITTRLPLERGVGRCMGSWNGWGSEKQIIIIIIIIIKNIKMNNAHHSRPFTVQDSTVSTVHEMPAQDKIVINK